MFLDKEQIKQLTGCARKAKQRDQLQKMHIPFRINARGEPIVCIQVIVGEKSQVEKSTWEPSLRSA